MVVLILFLFSFVGLKYIDPPIEYGMEINFGSSDLGKGLSLKSEKDNDSMTDEVDISEEVISPNEPALSETLPTKVITQKNSNSEVVDKINADSLITIDKKTENKISQNNIEIVKPKVSDVTKSIISNLTNSKSDSENPQGQGETKGLSDQGKSEGDPYSTIYYGQEGRGGQGVGYGLSGRSLQVNGKETQDCNESGVVVVRIVVNKLGEVTSAEPGVKGTTNNDPCLIIPAKNTALMHKWYPDENAPEKQIGFVVIEFKLVE